MHDLAARDARAAALFSAGNLKEAADMFEDALRGCRAMLAPDHHDTLSVAGDLGAARVSSGRREGIRLIAVSRSAHAGAGTRAPGHAHLPDGNGALPGRRRRPRGGHRPARRGHAGRRSAPPGTRTGPPSSSVARPSE
ncbi:tetratricopeptide repeat protein [Pseudonocardia cypriaca]|uniref:tetratricopeptide repeat protein n=1 Tax=Pseudonocardia cypriaca TaxID=882449 RepID=UPI003CCC7E6A